jgi:dTDP-4-amino-4,6-dideoxygalactose transaminase
LEVRRILLIKLLKGDNEVIAINRPLLDEEEVQAVSKVLRSCILTGRTERSDSEVRRFEKAFSQFVKSKYAFAVNSGTSALYMSLLAADVGPGSEVIVPSFTFVATAESVLMLGAKPVFVDINNETYNIDSHLIEKAITSKTKAIIPVDLFGLPADMKVINEIAVNHNLIVVEDAAQAHGAEYKGMAPGSFADLACWSFYASKNMTTGEGGMITTNEEKYRDIIPYMRSHGEKEEYISSMIGGNFRMPEMEAAIGNVQLSKLPGFLTARRKNAERLIERLDCIDELQLPIVPKGYKHSWYLFTVKLKNANEGRRDQIVNKLRKLGIGASIYYHCPVHLMPLYRRIGKSHLPVTEEVAKLVFSLPVHPGITPDELEHIIISTKKLLN